MKRTLLLTSLLSISAIYADSFESKKTALDAQQAAVDNAEKRVADLKDQLAAGTAQIASAAGKSEYAAEIDRLNEANRNLAKACNEAVEQCREANKRLQDVVSRCTGPGCEVVTENGKYSLRPCAEKATSKRTVANPAVTETPRAPYAKQGRTYPRTTSAHTV